MDIEYVNRIFPIGSERARVHLIRPDELVHLLYDIVPYKKALRDYFKSLAEWQNEIVYENRFFCNNDYQFNVKHWRDLLLNRIN